MTIKEFIIRAELKLTKERLTKLIELEAPDIMIDGVKEQVKELEQNIIKVGGHKALLEVEYISHETKTGSGGKTYVQFNNSINYFPNARYGRYIARKENI